MEYDLIIKDGAIVDGSGLPMIHADVGIKSGIVADVGRIRGRAHRTINADGLVVAPGFIDPHTHYDAQLCWDPLALTSSWHGVTTVVTGNCGYTLAPVRPQDWDYMTKTFAKVEGMSLEALERGIPWEWESFAQYLAVLERRLGVNVVPYVGHTAIRRYVLGDEASDRQATGGEIERMEAEVRRAMATGAAGFSTALSPSTVGWYEEPIPSRLASDDEVERLCGVVGDLHAGSLMILPRSSVFGIDAHDRAFLIRVAQETGRNVIIQTRLVQEAIDAAAPVFGLLQIRQFDRVFSLKNTSKGTSILDGMLSWGEVMRKSLDERLRLLRDDAFRVAMRRDALHPNTEPAKGVVLPGIPWDTTYVHRTALERNKRYEGKSIAQLAAEQRKEIADALLDLALDEGLDTLFRTCRVRNHDVEEALRRDLRSPYALVGISDAGAHLDRDDGADYTTYFLQEYVRNQQAFTLEEAIRMLTLAPASVLGLHDRGLLHPGYAADIVVFDPKRIGLASKGRQRIGLPSKGSSSEIAGVDDRYAAVPEGVEYTIVNGEVLMRDLKHEGAYPGRVLRVTEKGRAHR